MASLFSSEDYPQSIFSTMSALSRKHAAVDVGQGFPDFDPDAALLDRLAYHIRNGHNQYPPLPGVPALLEGIKTKVKRLHNVELDLHEEITITSGATQAIWTAVHAVVRPGDEVIVFEPAYDSYAPAVRSAGGTVVPFVLEGPTFQPDWDKFAALLSQRTRLVIINNPHNPTGTCWSDADFVELERMLAGREVALLSDEVYEHIVFDGKKHLSALSYPGLRERCFVTCSFGKTFHITGWKVGYVVAPRALMQRFRRLHQYTVFSVNAPAQYALADYLSEPASYEGLSALFAGKRDLLFESLKQSKLKLLPSAGSYYCLADYSAISDDDDMRFAERLIVEHGVATIPISPFYTEAPQGQTYVRLCFAKQTNTLTAAAQALCL